jgi:hypothetical protein
MFQKSREAQAYAYIEQAIGSNGKKNSGGDKGSQPRPFHSRLSTLYFSEPASECNPMQEYTDIRITTIQ